MESRVDGHINYLLLIIHFFFRLLQVLLEAIKEVKEEVSRNFIIFLLSI